MLSSIYSYCKKGRCEIILKDILILFRMWARGAKRPPLSVFPLLLRQNIEISPQNFMTFSFNPFAILV